MLGLGIGISKRRINSGYKELSLFGDNVVAFYPLNETSGITAYDIKNGYNATYSGTYTLNSAAPDGSKCALLSGNGNITASSELLLPLINREEGFISLWVSYVNINDWLSSKEIFTYYVDANNRMIVRTNTDGSFSSFVFAGTSQNVQLTDGFGTTEFIHIGYGWSKNENKITLYFNGILVKTSQYNGNFIGSFVSARFLHQINCYTKKILILNKCPLDSEVYKLVYPKGIIVFEGDSRSNAKGWTTKTMNLVSSLKLRYHKYGKTIVAVSGATPSDIITRASITNSFIQTNGLNILCVWIGVNSNETAQQIYDKIKLYCQNARASGWNKIILCTEIDAQSNMTWHNTIYPALNTLIYADHSFVDAIADLGARPELQDATNLTYYNADKIHLTAAGYAVVGEVVGAALNSLL